MSTIADMRKLRGDLIADTMSTYLGEAKASFASEYAWVRIGSGDVLTKADDAKKYFDAKKAHFDNPDTCAEPSPPDAALLSIVANVSRNNFWMQPCGGWVPPEKRRTEGNNPFVKVFCKRFNRIFSLLFFYPLWCFQNRHKLTQRYP